MSKGVFERATARRPDDAMRLELARTTRWSSGISERWSPEFRSLIAQREIEQRAAGEGHRAAFAGEDVSACPYGDGSPIAQRAWLGGFAQAQDH